MKRVIAYIESSFWACRGQEFDAMCRIAYRESDKLENILSASEFDEAGNTKKFESMMARNGDKLPGTRYVQMRENGVAVMDVNGVIAKRMSLFAEICFGGISTEALLKDFNTALTSPDVRSIILHIDSPGGEAFGINELAQAIYDARGKKPIKAYVSGLGCSGAYWIASACDEIICDKSSFLGSIGVVTSWTDDSGFYQSKGIRREVVTSSNAPYKRLNFDNEEHRQELQRELDSLESIFIKAVARNRKVTVEQVKKEFNQGGVLAGADAVKAKMADRVGSLESLIKEIARKGKQNASLNAILEGEINMGWRDKFKSFAGELGFNVSEKEDPVQETDQENKTETSENGETAPEANKPAETQTPATISEQQTAAEKRAEDAEAELSQVKSEKISAECDSFISAEINAGRMLPAEKKGFKSLYLQAAADDESNPLSEGSRVQSLKTIQEKRAPNTFTKEVLDPKKGLQVLSGEKAEDSETVSDARKQELMKKSPLGKSAMTLVKS